MATKTLSDPSGDVTEDLATKSGVVESIEKIWFRKLASTVIDADRCVQCGGCVAACPSKSLAIAEDDKPTLVKMCTGCSCCWDSCPRGGLRYERLWKLVGGDEAAHGIGVVKAAYSARALRSNLKAQDGGVVTAILEELLKAGEIDGAIVAVSSGPFRGEARVAKTVEEIRASAGSVYSPTLSLSQLNSVPQSGLGADAKLALVGTPCQISGLKYLQRFDWKYRDGGAGNVKYTIALMCTRSFHPGRLTQKLKAAGVDTKLVKKMDVKENTIRLYGEDGGLLFEDDAKLFRDAAIKGCEECADFTGRLADITVGSVGSPRGFSSILIRTPQGERAWSIAKDALEQRPLEDIDAVAKVEQRNLKKALRGLRREFNPDAPLWIGYNEHLVNYCGTDKAPVKPASYRIHHYSVTC